MHGCAMYAYTYRGVSAISICTHRCMLSFSSNPCSWILSERNCCPAHPWAELPVTSNGPLCCLRQPQTLCCQELLRLSLRGDTGALGALSHKVRASKATGVNEGKEEHWKEIIFFLLSAKASRQAANHGCSLSALFLSSMPEYHS